MSKHYNQKYTKKEVNEILKKIKDCINNNRYKISLNQNRLENRQFIFDYKIDNKLRKKILLQIRLEDFCHSIQNKNIGFEKEVLYVFVTKMKLTDIKDVEKEIEIYIKFNIIKGRETENVIVISFHEKNKPIDYIF